MKNLFITILCLMLMSSTCSKNDHYYVTIKNQSEDDVMVARMGGTVDGRCGLDPINGGGILKGNSAREYQPFNFSIERSLGEGILELYIVDINHFNDDTLYYDCDSIPIKNNILRHYKLTLEDLKRSNFTITYP